MSDPVDSTLAVLPHRLSGEDRKTSQLPSARVAIRAHWQILLAVLLAVSFTVVSQAFPFTMSSRSGDTMIDTVASLISALAAFVFVERLRPTRQRRDLLIALSLGMVSAGNLLLAAGPTVVNAHPLPGYMQICVTLLAAGAAVDLARHSARSGDGLERSLAAGVAVLGIAHFNYFLAPSMVNDRLYAGDILKLSAFLLILYGCVIEFRTLQSELAQRVAVGERRRMARDMHDGLAQELAFIASHSQRLRHTGDDATTVAHLQSAAERALHDSRTTIAVLTAPEDVPLDQLIERTVESFRSRFGVEIELELDPNVVVEAEFRNALLRILHEALINAVRHGSAQQVLVRLGAGSAGRSLRIADDGTGFDVQAAVSAGKGLGLTSMQERAGILGASLSIISSPGAGTVVEVGLP
ncbi:MAG TPA: ATP-binding protein [Solirubrobacteraceae bacterium]|nr:ATP-binding protein [Solirubrobacteraceae bacterium]